MLPVDSDECQHPEFEPVGGTDDNPVATDRARCTSCGFEMVLIQPDGSDLDDCGWLATGACAGTCAICPFKVE